MDELLNSLKNIGSRWYGHSNFPVLLLIFFNICLGLFVFHNYGASWDEADNQLYGENSLKAYTWWWEEDVNLEDYLGTDQRYRGPVYAVIATGIVSLLQRVNGSWAFTDLWHLFNFLTFQLGVFFFYKLCIRYIGRWGAFGGTILFVSQPLFWGHSFINSKDIPFMVIFLGSMALGLDMVDEYLPRLGVVSGNKMAPNLDTGSKRFFSLLIAGLFLGFGISIRVLGLMAGLLLAVYFFLKARWRSIPILVLYFTVAGLVAYITWPFLWPAPFANIVESLRVSSDFAWKGVVLFQGKYYEAGALPRRYFPVLLLLQFTEPVYILSFLGGIAALFRVVKKKIAWEAIGMIAAWFVVPAVLVVLLKPRMYDNFRHFLFIMPPVFFFCGVALDTLYHRVRSSAINLIILLIFVMPGIYWGVYLHPYEYIYYNSFNGGINGAYREYELDYWVTSYREASLFLNEHAPTGSHVLVAGPREIFSYYAREDLQGAFSEADIETAQNPVYLIVMTRYGRDKTTFPDAETLYEVIRGDSVLAVVRKIK